MSDGIIERGAVRLFWKAEHLDPSEEGDVPESEWFGEAFPANMNERRREFWRLLMKEAIAAMRPPTEAMINATGAPRLHAEAALACGADVSVAVAIYQAMIDAALNSDAKPA